MTAREPVHTDSDLCGLVSELVGGAIRRQFWLLFLDDRDRPVPLVVPLEDVPESPTDDELGVLVATSCRIAREADAVQVVVVWERPGGPELGPADRRVSQRLESAYPVEPEEGDEGHALRLRAQLLSHSEGVMLV